jgi:hypothetical protein
VAALQWEQNGAIRCNPEQAKSYKSVTGGLTLSWAPESFRLLERCGSFVQFSGQFIDHVAREKPLPFTGNTLKNEVGMLCLRNLFDKADFKTHI